MWPFGPMALVYDVMDTEGEELAPGALAFAARGDITEKRIGGFRQRVQEKGIIWTDLDAGDAKAGSIRCEQRATGPKEQSVYRMFVNKNHPPPTRFATLAREWPISSWAILVPTPSWASGIASSRRVRCKDSKRTASPNSCVSEMASHLAHIPTWRTL